jgi:hypothetical protein
MSRRTAIFEHEHEQDRQPLTIAQVLHLPIVWLVLGVMLATLMLIVGTRFAVHTTPSAPADMFMQSVVKRDGALGWHQLCPALQARLPLGQLAEQARTQLTAESHEGLTLKVDYIGAHPRPEGGQLRFYVVTAHRSSDGWMGTRTYVVYTQASGCVEDVQNF